MRESSEGEPLGSGGKGWESRHVQYLFSECGDLEVLKSVDATSTHLGRVGKGWESRHVQYLFSECDDLEVLKSVDATSTHLGRVGKGCWRVDMYSICLVSVVT